MSLQEEVLDTNVQVKTSFQELNFPISFEFKIGTLANDFIAKDLITQKEFAMGVRADGLIGHHES